MAVVLSPETYTKFVGIREQNGINSGGTISAINAENVEFFQSDIGANTGIKSSNGNVMLTQFEGYKVIGCFASTQDGIVYDFIYVENDLKGALYYINRTHKEPILLVDNLPLTGKANGLTMTSTAYDVFVFTNGLKQYTISFAQEQQIKEINAIDYQQREIHWLAMCEWNGFLVVASDYGIHASHQNDIYTWNDDPKDIADSWYIDFSKKVTAIVGFSSGLFIFTQSDVTKLIGNPNSDTSSLELVSMNGTLDYNSIVLHDTYLFFYDPLQKNIYYMQITDTGQTRPTGPVAKEIQSYFSVNINRFMMTSCIYSGFNEIWCIINDNILIFDYAKQEWTKRSEQKINTICLSRNRVLTGTDDGKILLEKVNLDFDEQFYPAVYQTSYINFSSDTNLKKQKTPLLISLNKDGLNDFWVELTINNKKKNPKRIILNTGENGVYGDDVDDEILTKNQIYDTATYAPDDIYAKQIIEISTPQTWYSMSIKLYTDRLGQGFTVNAIELKNVKAKTKTKGR